MEPTPKIISTVSPNNHKGAIIWGFLTTLVLVVGLVVGVMLVPKQQDIRSKAVRTLGSGWTKNPNPADGATGVSLSPTFAWEFETPDNSSSTCNPVGSYSTVYLWDCALHNDSCLFGFGSKPSDTQSVYSLSATEIHPYLEPGKPDYSKTIAPLKPNKQYWWHSVSKTCGLFHFEENRFWTFTTASEATAACQLVSADKNLATTKINDVITFTGRGVTSSDTEIIDKINFIISKDSVEVSNTEEAAAKDGTSWKAIKAFTVTTPGSYRVRIRVHWKNQNVWKE